MFLDVSEPSLARISTPFNKHHIQNIRDHLQSERVSAFKRAARGIGLGVGLSLTAVSAIGVWHMSDEFVRWALTIGGAVPSSALALYDWGISQNDDRRHARAMHSAQYIRNGLLETQLNNVGAAHAQTLSAK